jgi:hypothetical protein
MFSGARDLERRTRAPSTINGADFSIGAIANYLRAKRGASHWLASADGGGGPERGSQRERCERDESGECVVVVTAVCDAACQRARDFRNGGLRVLIQGARDAQCTEAAYICLSNVPLTGPFASPGDIIRQTQNREACMTAQRICDMASTANRANPRQPFIVSFPDGTMVVIERGGSRITRIGNPGGFSRPWPPGSGD